MGGIRLWFSYNRRVPCQGPEVLRCTANEATLLQPADQVAAVFSTWSSLLAMLKTLQGTPKGAPATVLFITLGRTLLSCSAGLALGGSLHQHGLTGAALASLASPTALKRFGPNTRCDWHWWWLRWQYQKVGQNRRWQYVSHARVYLPLAAC